MFELILKKYKKQSSYIKRKTMNLILGNIFIILFINASLFIEHSTNDIIDYIELIILYFLIIISYYYIIKGKYVIASNISFIVLIIIMFIYNIMYSNSADSINVLSSIIILLFIVGFLSMFAYKAYQIVYVTISFIVILNILCYNNISEYTYSTISMYYIAFYNAIFITLGIFSITEFKSNEKLITQILVANETLKEYTNKLEYKVHKNKNEIDKSKIILQIEKNKNKNISKALQKSEDLYRTVVENINEAIVILKRNKIVYINPKTEEILAMKADDILYRDFSIFLLDDNINDLLFKKKENKLKIRIRDGHGKTKWISILIDEIEWDGEKSLLLSFIDISESIFIEEQIDKLTEDLIEAQHIAHVGNWEYDIKKDLLYCSAETSKMFDLNNTISITGKDVLKKLDIKQRKSIMNNIYRGKSKESYELLVNINGTYKYINIKFKKTYENNKLVRLIGTTQDISKQKLVEQTLKENSELKSQFLANMSHEIRTPMNGIIGMNSLLSLTNLTEEQREYVEWIDSSAHTLLQIINDILDFSKIQSEKIELEEIKLDLYDLIDKSMGAIKAKAYEKGIKLEKNIEENVPQYIIGDPIRISQILFNLFSNSIKFTQKGYIAIEVVLLGKIDDRANILFKIYDTGIGIPKDKIYKIFDSFRQADGSTTRKYGGTGLGLSITKSLVELMGGNIKVYSDIGKGSSFEFNIKLKLLKL